MAISASNGRPPEASRQRVSEPIIKVHDTSSDRFSVSCKPAGAALESRTMRAAVLHETADIDSAPLRIAEVENPMPRAGEVRVRVNSCAVCRTDLHVIEGDLPAQRRPVIPGHQIVGVVDSVGEGCTRLTTASVYSRRCCAARRSIDSWGCWPWPCHPAAP